MLLLFECTTHSSSFPVEEIKLFAIANWIFQVSDFSRLLRMSFKYGLILLGYSSTEKVLFLSPLLLYSKELLLQKLLTLTCLEKFSSSSFSKRFLFLFLV